MLSRIVNVPAMPKGNRSNIRVNVFCADTDKAFAHNLSYALSVNQLLPCGWGNCCNQAIALIENWPNRQ